MSIIEFHPANKDGHPCGYCKSSGYCSYGMSAYQLNPDDYQKLIDRGWRRCGTYLYKTVMEKTCCPTFTIRCKALEIKPTRSQRKTLKRVSDFIVFGKTPKSTSNPGSDVCGSKISSKFGHESPPRIPSNIPSAPMNPHDSSRTSSNQRIKKEETSIKPTECSIPIENCESRVKTLTQLYPKERKAKFIRMKRKLNKMMDRRKCSEEDALAFMLQERQDKLRKLEKSFEKFFGYSSPSKSPSHKIEFQYSLVNSRHDYPNFRESFELYKKYQVDVHGDDPNEVTPSSFESFLIRNSFKNIEPFADQSHGIPHRYGTYHMKYLLDGKLIAVSVLDILPTSVSSVYFYYDRNYSFLSLGTYSAMREILLVRELNAIKPDFENYYMGFYIHSCPKMRYKGQYNPSFLLCYQAFTWNRIENCLSKLNAHKFPRLEPDLSVEDEESNNITDNDIQMLYFNPRNDDRKVINFSSLKKLNLVDVDNYDVHTYAKLIGRTLARTMHFVVTPSI
ncbi:arginyltransferase 1 isoform X2 [Brevipalpus obovatus]|uniref:arginyltransferase 1 isoform X2 n=1 Tax=Brevipalpus obovatus TaxID=246614 RepID=UPI003D9EF8EA